MKESMQKYIWFGGGILLGVLLSVITLAGVAVAAEAVWRSEQEPERLRQEER